MKKHFLLSFLMTLVGIFTMQATNVIINVDKAANVIVSTNSGYGKTLDLGSCHLKNIHTTDYCHKIPQAVHVINNSYFS